MLRRLLACAIPVTGLVAASACGSAAKNDANFNDSGGSGGSSVSAQGGATGTAGGSNVVGGGGKGTGGGSAGSGSSTDPNTCEGAAALKSYVGCDYWPTVVANNVWSVFDYAVIVANAGNDPVTVTVTRAGMNIGTTTVAGNGLTKLYLPWVPELKGPDTDAMGSAMPLTKTVGVLGGAYHLVSDRPVTVYQFNALEYKGSGGPAGKNWGACPGNGGIGCFSYSNDASLLLPSTAMTGNYRVAGNHGWVFPPPLGGGLGPYFAVTGTQNGTTVKVKLSTTAQVLAGAGIGNIGSGQIATFTLNAGDVVEIVGPPTADFSGSLVQADKPVQVISGMPCDDVPEGAAACDHIEETVFPAETMGKHYIVTPPTGPNGNVPGHVVRLVGNVDGTQLTYSGGPPVSNAPKVINAGQVIELGQVAKEFEITGDHEFEVVTLMLGGSVQDPHDPTSTIPSKGDPSLSFSTAVEQYRTKYVFLAPDDYDVSYADIIVPMGAKVTLDGMALSAAPKAIGTSGFGVARQLLGPGKGGAHVIESDQPVGLQVMGYGSYTSYQYPGGLNLIAIAPPPPPLGLATQRHAREIARRGHHDRVDRAARSRTDRRDDADVPGSAHDPHRDGGEPGRRRERFHGFAAEGSRRAIVTGDVLVGIAVGLRRELRREHLRRRGHRGPPRRRHAGSPRGRRFVAREGLAAVGDVRLAIEGRRHRGGLGAGGHLRRGGLDGRRRGPGGRRSGHDGRLRAGHDALGRPQRGLHAGGREGDLTGRRRGDDRTRRACRGDGTRGRSVRRRTRRRGVRPGTRGRRAGGRSSRGCVRRRARIRGRHVGHRRGGHGRRDDDRRRGRGGPRGRGGGGRRRRRRRRGRRRGRRSHGATDDQLQLGSGAREGERTVVVTSVGGAVGRPFDPPDGLGGVTTSPHRLPGRESPRNVLGIGIDRLRKRHRFGHGGGK
jgi:uncharacterized protein affecting Mg2+/Co2+ transport